MNRDIMLNNLRQHSDFWDIIIIGGGATGLGCAVESASRGYRTLLLEQHDFAKGTSSRSTKLVHGGVRYLRQGNISLVLEALHERGLLANNAPHLVHHQSFIVPNYEWWEGPFYGIGLKMYDMLAGKLGLGPSRLLSREETLKHIPTLEPHGLRGGVIYYDGQFDDARLAINLAQTAADLGATLLNYMPVTALLKEKNMTHGVAARDEISGETFEIFGRVVINATGVFTDNVRKMDDPETPEIILPSQGVHIVLEHNFLPGQSAIMVPETDDGRVLFAVPWHGKVIVGTTDTPVPFPMLEPRPMKQEIDFILKHAARYLTKDPTYDDILSTFAGLRPLVKSSEQKSSAALSRDHTVLVSPSGLLTITGGKWTTYRKMAEDAIYQAAMIAGLPQKESRTANLRIHGWLKNSDEDDHLSVYGSDVLHLRQLIKDSPELAKPLHLRLPYIEAEVVWAVQAEMAQTVEDILARRTRALLLDARAAIEAAPKTAAIMAEHLGKSEQWVASQIWEFTELAKNYLPRP
jgi:glycerol-3-phosphate dehydrogenase